MTGIKIGHTDITDIGKIKIGNTDIQEVYVGSDKIWPAGSSVDDPPEIEILLDTGERMFGFKTNSPFTVEQDGGTVHYPPAPSSVIVRGVHSGSFIKIILLNNDANTQFSFSSLDIIKHIKLNNIGKMVTLGDRNHLPFYNLTRMTTFECAADISTLTGFLGTWNKCTGLTSFPAIDTSSVTNFSSAWFGCIGLTTFPALDFSSATVLNNAWNGCLNLVCISGTLDFNKVSNGSYAFYNCSALTAPASAGTPVRNGDNATVGIWTNPNPCIPVNLPVEADFGGSPVHGVPPLYVIFKDHSTNSPTRWLWDFGDGNTSTIQNPRHAYSAVGNYTVKLTASSVHNSFSKTKNNYITVVRSHTGRKPVAAFDSSNPDGEAPHSVHFIDHSINRPTSWIWNFGDGTISRVQNPAHTYFKHGVYTVSLIASNSHGTDKVIKLDYATITQLSGTYPEIEIKIKPGDTSFGFKTNSPFTIEQDGTIFTHSATPAGAIISGVHGTTFIKISLTNNLPTTTFVFNYGYPAEFWRDVLHVKLNNVGRMTSLYDGMIGAFEGLVKMTTFECAADLVGITNFTKAWMECRELTSFPIINTISGINFTETWRSNLNLTSFPQLDISSGTDFTMTWRTCRNLTGLPAMNYSSARTVFGAWIGCKKLTCFAGTLDFTSLASRSVAFQDCTALAAPAPYGTPVRYSDYAVNETWTNPRPCP